MPFGLKLATARFGEAVLSPAFAAALCLHHHQHSPSIRRGGDSPKAEALDNFVLCFTEFIDSTSGGGRVPKFLTDVARFLEAFSGAVMDPRHPLVDKLLAAYSKASWGHVMPPYLGEVVRTSRPATDGDRRSEKRALGGLGLRFHDRSKLRSALVQFRHCNNRSRVAFGKVVFGVVTRPLDLAVPDLWESIAFAYEINEVMDIGRPSYVGWARRIANHSSNPCGLASSHIVTALARELRELHSLGFPMVGTAVAGAWSTIGIAFRTKNGVVLNAHRKRLPLLSKVCGSMERRLLQEVQDAIPPAHR